MARFGQGINPQLGAIDYSPIMQGTAAYGQGVAQMGAGIGAGIQNFLGQVGAGVQKYYQKKEEKELVQGVSDQVKSFLKGNPAYAQQLGIRDPSDDKAIGVAIKAAGGGDAKQGAMVTSQMLRQFSQVAQEQAAQRAAMSSLVPPQARVNQYMMAGGMNPQAFLMDQARLANIESDTAKNLAAAQPQGPSKAVDPVGVRIMGPNGQPIERTIDRITGRVLAEGPVTQPKYVLSAEEQIKVEGGKRASEEEAKRASEFVTAISDAAENAQPVIAQASAIRNLYEQGTQSGFGQDWINTAGALANRLGMLPAGSQANREQLQKLLAENALQNTRVLIQGQGQVSNYEREMINKASADVGKSPEANLRIIRMGEAVAQRSIDAELERQRLVDEGKSTPQIAESLRRWRSKNTLGSYLEKSSEQKQAEDKAPSGVDDALWNAMTPEEKALWRK